MKILSIRGLKPPFVIRHRQTHTIRRIFHPTRPSTVRRDIATRTTNPHDEHSRSGACDATNDDDDEERDDDEDGCDDDGRNDDDARRDGSARRWNATKRWNEMMDRNDGTKRTTGWKRDTGDDCTISVRRNGSRLSRSFPHLIGRSFGSRSAHRGPPGFPPSVRSFVPSSFDPPSHRFENPPTGSGRRAIRFQSVILRTDRSDRLETRSTSAGFSAESGRWTTKRWIDGPTDRDATARCDAIRYDLPTGSPDHPSFRSVDRTRPGVVGFSWICDAHRNLGRVVKKSILDISGNMDTIWGLEALI